MYQIHRMYVLLESLKLVERSVNRASTSYPRNPCCPLQVNLPRYKFWDLGWSPLIKKREMGDHFVVYFVAPIKNVSRKVSDFIWLSTEKA